MRLIDKINAELNSFSKTERKLVKYINNNTTIIYQTINEVMESSGVGYGTIIRFCKKVGCSGFQDFKIMLASEGFADTGRKDYQAPLLDEIKQRVCQQVEMTLRNIRQNSLADIITAIEQANKILIIGVAGSFPVAMELTYRLTRLGFANAIAEADKDMQAFRASLLKEHDLLIVFSYSGMTKSILKAAELAKKSGAKIIAVTNYTKSALTTLADHILVTSIKEQAFEAEIGTRIPFYLIVELLTTSIIEKDEKYLKAIELTYHSVSDSQI